MSKPNLATSKLSPRSLRLFATGANGRCVTPADARTRRPDAPFTNSRCVGLLRRRQAARLFDGREISAVADRLAAACRQPRQIDLRAGIAEADDRDLAVATCFRFDDHRPPPGDSKA